MGRQGSTAATRADDEILLKVARQVLQAIVDGKGNAIALVPLIRGSAAPHYKPEELTRSDDAESRVVCRLIDRFDRHRDDLLTRVTTRDDYARAQVLRIIDEILDRLESLGVSVRREELPQM